MKSLATAKQTPAGKEKQTAEPNALTDPNGQLKFVDYPEKRTRGPEIPNVLVWNKASE
jgi:hypothetical protein